MKGRKLRLGDPTSPTRSPRCLGPLSDPYGSSGAAADPNRSTVALGAHQLTDVLFLTVRPEESDLEPSRLRGVVVASCATSLVDDDDGGFYVAPDPAGSVTQHVASLLPGARVVGALHLITEAHMTLASVGALISDVPVVGDDREATDLVEALIDEIPGFSAAYAGRLSSAAAVEGMAAVLREVETTRGRPVGIKIGNDGHFVVE